MFVAQPYDRTPGRTFRSFTLKALGKSSRSIRAQKGGTRIFDFNSNMLAQSFDRPPLGDKPLPRYCLDFLNDVAPTDQEGLTRKQDVPVTELPRLAGPDLVQIPRAAFTSPTATNEADRLGPSLHNARDSLFSPAPPHNRAAGLHAARSSTGKGHTSRGLSPRSIPGRSVHPLCSAPGCRRSVPSLASSLAAPV
jgi:hypothetical protein